MELIIPFHVLLFCLFMIYVVAIKIRQVYVIDYILLCHVERIYCRICLSLINIDFTCNAKNLGRNFEFSWAHS